MMVPKQEETGTHPVSEEVSEHRAPDLSSLAIGGTIGGIIAAKALKEAMATGARTIVPAWAPSSASLRAISFVDATDP